MTEAQLLAQVKRDVKALGVRGFARKAKVSAAYVSEVVRGTRFVGPKLAKHYGLRMTRTIGRTFGK